MSRPSTPDARESRTSIRPSHPDWLSTSTIEHDAAELVGRVEAIRGAHDPNLAFDRARTLAKGLATKISKLAGRSGATARRSTAPVTPLDAYDPGSDTVAPISVRPTAMELLWVCGDCGEHYPRSFDPPHACVACGAPKEHFFAPIED